MATLGITYFLEGLGQTLFGSDIYKIDVGMPKEPIFALDSVFQGGILINKEDVIAAAAIAAGLVALLSVFFQKTSTGRALRAVADDHQAAQSIGIPLNQPHLGDRGCVAGVVALVAGMIWGSKLGRAVLADHRGPARPARGDSGRPDFGARRHHRRSDHRCGREAVGGVPGPVRGRGHRDLVCVCAGAGVPFSSALRACSEKKIIDRV